MTTSRGDGFVSQVDVDPASGDLKIGGVAVSTSLTRADVNLLAGANAASVTASDIQALAGGATPLTQLANADANEVNLLDRSAYVSWFSDFLGGVDPDEITVTAGSGTGNAVAISPTTVGGAMSIASASDDGAIGANASAIELAGLGWKASQGLWLETRLQIDDISEAYIFIGFTDVLPSTTLEAPIYLNAADIDSDATDAVGVVYDVDGTTAEWCHGGVKAGTDTTPAYSGTAPVDNTSVTIGVSVSTAGAVTGYVDGTAIGTAVANAVTTTTALAPVIVVANRSANQVTALVDYLLVVGGRS